ncbi:MAG: beta-galactosidase trimerization domain-containing protein [Bryobacteraceae bacterium]
MRSGLHKPAGTSRRDWMAIGAFLAAWRVAPAQPSAGLPFEKRVCRIYFDPMRPLAYDPVEKKQKPAVPFYGRTVEEVVDLVAGMGAEVWSAGVTWKGIWYPSTMVARNPEIPQDQLARLIQEAHRKGMLVLALQQLSEPEDRDLEGRMEQWKLYPIEDGRGVKPDKRWQSFLSPYREWKGRFLAEHIRMADFDGFWFDATPFANRGVRLPWAAGDVGPYGREVYRRETGQEVPQKVDWNSQAFREWVRWRYDKTLEFFEAVTAEAKKAKPRAAAVMNYYARPRLNWEVAHPLRKLESNWYPSIEAESSLLDKVGRALTPRCEMWMWAFSNVPEIVHGEAPYVLPDRAIARGLRCLANGVVPCYGGLEADIDLWKDAMQATFAELRARRDLFGGETVKYAALVVSQQTRDFRPEAEAAMWRAVEGIHEIQNAGHLLTDVLFDDSLTAERLAAYPLVILPGVACLSDAQCDALRHYVSAGGTLVATMETSLYDEWGKRRPGFALAEILGVEYEGPGEDATQVLLPHTPDLCQGLGRVVALVGPSTRVRLASAGGADVLFAASPRRNLGGFSFRRDKFDSGVPAITRKRHGKGAAIYVSADFGQAYLRHRLWQVAHTFVQMQRAAVTPPIKFRAPKVLETTAAWRGPKEILVHLVNCTPLGSLNRNDMDNGYGQMAPLADIGITLHRGGLRRASSALSGRPLDLKGNTATVPVVRHGEVIRLELL